MSSYLLGEIPFKTVYLHGLVTDKDGKKISKSMGNNLDPLDLIREYGADAVRMSLIVGVGPGNDSKISLEKVKAYKLFANKLWNVTRFILSSTEGVVRDSSFSDYVPADKAHLEAFDALVKEIGGEMDEYKYYLVGEKLYHYAWHELADKILEESKPILSGTDEKAKASRAQLLLALLTGVIKALHPFMPYVTEEIWSEIGGQGASLLMVEPYPQQASY
jgi:valyl-tRNA synthetase